MIQSRQKGFKPRATVHIQPCGIHFADWGDCPVQFLLSGRGHLEPGAFEVTMISISAPVKWPYAAFMLAYNGWWEHRDVPLVHIGSYREMPR